MTTDPAHLSPPAHPVPELTTSELAGYRRQLEHALAGRATGATPDTADLRRKLSEVLAEQDQRAQIRHRGPAAR